MTSTDSINILIVDDEPKNLTVIEAVLTDPSYRVMRAESAEQALLSLLTEDFALIILDVRMPGMTGFELAAVIKDRKKTARVPIIFLTAYYNEDSHVLEGYGSGAVDYLHKPVSPSVLRSKVAIFAELHRRERESARANKALLAEVNERQKAESELQGLNEALQRNVFERTEALESLRRSEQRQNVLLEQSRLMQERLSDLSRQLLQAQEEERRRISGELNELIVQSLAAISQNLTSLRSNAAASPEEIEDRIVQTQRLLGETMDEVRRFASDLRPAMLDDLGLIPSLRQYLQEFTDRTGIGVELKASDTVEELDSGTRTTLYRVAQEALTNVALHAKAGRVAVRISTLEGGFSMEIQDDGQGFEAGGPGMGHNEGLGLLRMKARVEMIGGRLNIESARGSPTTLRVEVPTRGNRLKDRNHYAG
ncbi:MAG: response regulator [Archangium sp.]|nr:response regulator [Archangium sp.]MDP3156854.1 response regulator [Archangium sp.]MDP3575531.1 response regulator [Archangium sp.]